MLNQLSHPGASVWHVFYSESSSARAKKETWTLKRLIPPADGEDCKEMLPATIALFSQSTGSDESCGHYSVEGKTSDSVNAVINSVLLFTWNINSFILW